jgi:ABC-type sugar transport system permease subunit
MFGRSNEKQARYRPYALAVFIFIAGLVVLFVVLIVRSMFADRAATTQSVYRGWLPWVMILPAVFLIGLWGYYPLFRGLVMAFQDYRIAGESPFVGLDNFIFSKLRRITLPTLLPLIIINFVGTFVATFQNMGNIFLLTFGGPGEATMVVGMRWQDCTSTHRTMS